MAIQACDPDRNVRFADAVCDAGGIGATARRRSDRGRHPRSAIRRRVALTLSSGLGLLTVAGFIWWSFAGPSRVDVNFITDRFDATIWLDDRPLCTPKGTPYTTPCTVPGLPADAHQVVFKHPGRMDLEVGRIDFSEAREIVAQWPMGETP